jgi:hypothetical protein
MISRIPDQIITTIMWLSSLWAKSLFFEWQRPAKRYAWLEGDMSIQNQGTHVVFSGNQEGNFNTFNNLEGVVAAVCNWIRWTQLPSPFACDSSDIHEIPIRNKKHIHIMCVLQIQLGMLISTAHHSPAPQHIVLIHEYE